MAIEDYEIEFEPAARGAQGRVHFGVRLSDGLQIALKVAAPGRGAADALEMESKLLQEMARAGVSGTVVCLERLSWEGRPAMVMPRYASHMGEWLTEIIAHPVPSTLDDILAQILALCRTLAQVHAVQTEGGRVVHRDVKPENIFLDRDGHPHLGDFGGAMAVEGLKAVELALFGTPMWAPLDQILPGKTIPDPTWDTYAACVLLYAALTGARPAYQADPRELLTPAGKELWEAARNAVSATPTERRHWHIKFARMRTGSSPHDLVDPIGRAALLDSDHKAIESGVRNLCKLAGVDARRAGRIARHLWDILSRGLSPVSHPSPPNRYRDANALADALAEVRGIARKGGTPTASGALSARKLHGLLGDVTDEITMEAGRPPPSALSSGMPLFGCVLLMGTVGVTVVSVGFWQRDLLLQASVGLLPGGPEVEIPLATGAIWLDRTEVTNASCVASGICPANPREWDTPAIGLNPEDASRYCASVGGRLPTEAEWLAAHGPGPWPWGSASPTCAHAIALGCGDSVGPVASTAMGRSPLGLDDMAGNAWEWVLREDGSPILIGGSASSTAAELGRGGLKALAPGEDPGLAGVRCAYDSSP